MTARVATALGVVVMAGLLLLYLVFVAQYAIRLLVDDQPVGVAMGIALLVLPLVGAWALGAELLFGVRGDRLGRRLEAEGGLPDERLERLPSGRLDREQAERVFPRYRDEAEAKPESWQAWYRLGLAYDACGDRRRARWAVRRAIRLSRFPR